MDCLRAANGGSGGVPAPTCDAKALSREYLECRMSAGLMAREDLSQLGFSADALAALAAPVTATDDDEPVPVKVAGLSSLRAKTLAGPFGMSLPSRPRHG